MRGLSLRHAPDLVIAARVVLAFAVLGLLSLPFGFAVAGVALIVVVIAMDALDGYLARTLGIADDLGAVLDITGDRIVEHVFWIYFAVAGVAPVWAPLVIVTRSWRPHVVGVSSLAAGHLTLVPALVSALREAGREDILVVVGGVVPPSDHARVFDAGAAAIFGPGTVIADAARELLDKLNESLGYT